MLSHLRGWEAGFCRRCVLHGAGFAGIPQCPRMHISWPCPAPPCLRPRFDRHARPGETDSQVAVAAQVAVATSPVLETSTVTHLERGSAPRQIALAPCLSPLRLAWMTGGAEESRSCRSPLHAFSLQERSRTAERESQKTMAIAR